MAVTKFSSSGFFTNTSDTNNMFTQLSTTVTTTNFNGSTIYTLANATNYPIGHIVCLTINYSRSGSYSVSTLPYLAASGGKWYMAASFQFRRYDETYEEYNFFWGCISGLGTKTNVMYPSDGSFFYISTTCPSRAIFWRVE